jgi:aspartate carbamoyltransferase regulatory subunit
LFLRNYNSQQIIHLQNSAPQYRLTSAAPSTSLQITNQSPINQAATQMHLSSRIQDPIPSLPMICSVEQSIEKPNQSIPSTSVVEHRNKEKEMAGICRYCERYQTILTHHYGDCPELELIRVVLEQNNADAVTKKMATRASSSRQ